MSFTSRTVTPDYAVAGQLAPADMEALREQGFRSVINNRPDGEEPGQPNGCDIAHAAAAAGLGYAHIPVSGPISPDQATAMREALSTLPGPVLAFCRSGARSTRLWAHANRPQMDREAILATAAAAGCDVSALASELA